MRSKRILGIVLLTGLMVVGVWLFIDRTAPVPEAVSRQEALLRAYAPAGLTGNTGAQMVGALSGVAEPMTVNLDPANPPTLDVDPDEDLWLDGQVDIGPIESPVSQGAIAAMRAEALRMGPSANVSLLADGPGILAPSIITGFDSIDVDDCCNSEPFSTLVPPDPEMAAGPNHVMVAVNNAFAIYDKNGNPVLANPVGYAAFFSPLEECTGLYDPNMLYDEKEGRWFTGIAANGDYYCAAVSDDDDPAGSWNVYAFAMDLFSDDFFDYPHAGIGDDAVYMGANIFINSGGFREARVYAFDKAAMYAGLAASYRTINLGGGDALYFTPQPLNLHGFAQGTWPGGEPHAFVVSRNFNGATNDVFTWDDPFGSNLFAYQTTIDLDAATGNVSGFPVEAPQDVVTTTLDSNDWRPQDFEYRNGSGWGTYTIACNPGSGVVNCVRFFEIDLDRFSPNQYGLVQAGDFASDGEHLIFGDLAVNHCGDVALGYTKTSDSMFPGVYATGRLNTDAPGTLSGETTLKVGEAPYESFQSSNPNRWGDYSGMTIDPDGLTFWYFGEYAKAQVSNATTNWANYVGAMRYDSCELAPDFTVNADPPDVLACVGTDAVFTIDVGAIVGFAGDVTLSAVNLPAGVTGGFSVNPVTPPDTSDLTLDTSGGAAGSYSFDVVGVSGALVHTTTLSLELDAGAPNAPTLASPANGATQQSVKPILTWAGTAPEFLVEVATDAGFTDVVDSATVSGNSYTVGVVLDLGSTYYWRVSAANACGSSASAANTFTTIADGACEQGTFPQLAYYEDFSGGANGWSSEAPVGTDTWVITDTNASPNSGGNAFFGEDYEGNGLQRLTSPAIPLPGGNSQLTLQFQNYQAFEDPSGSGGCWDGGILEISTDSGQSWTQLDPELLNDPYDGALNATPISGDFAWCGATQDWTNAIVNLDAYAGQTVQVRMSIATDAFIGADGWYIDDVAVLSCSQVPTDVSLTGFDGEPGGNNMVWLLPVLLVLATAAFVGVFRLTAGRQET